MSEKQPHAVDLYAGERLHAARKKKGLSRQALGKSLKHPISFQQVQKYEQALNRLTLWRLYEFAAVLEEPISYFLPYRFDEILLPVAPTEMQLVELYRALPETSQEALLTLLKAKGANG